jgi:large subunit ribosomal protein L24
MKCKIKKGDTVKVIAGDYKGKQGKVIEVLPKKGKVKVEGVNVVVRHKKARAQGQKSGRVSLEAFMDISNVAPVSTVRATSKKSKDQE